MPSPIIIPASITPAITAITLFLKSISKRLAAKVPVQAPVPGSGIPTNKNSAQYKPLPTYASNFFPPFSPLSRQNLKNFPINFLSEPHTKTFLAKKNMNGTGSIFPIIKTGCGAQMYRSLFLLLKILWFFF